MTFKNFKLIEASKYRKKRKSTLKLSTKNDHLNGYVRDSPNLI